MANIGATQQACKRVHHLNRIVGLQKCACCSPTSGRHTTILQAEQTHQIHCILQKIYNQLQKFQGQQAISHSNHTRFGPGSDLLCEDGTTDFICTKIKDLKGQGEVASTSSLKILYPLIDQEGIPRVGIQLQQ
jgi:hypothetical protein